MNETLQKLEEVGAYLAGDVINAVFVLFGVILLFLIAYLARRIGGTELGRQVIDIWKLVDEHILNVAFSTTFAEHYDPETAAKLAEDYKKQYGTVIDPRLAFAVKAVETEIENHSQIDFDFFYVMNKVEGIYQAKVKPLK